MSCCLSELSQAEERGKEIEHVTTRIESWDQLFFASATINRLKSGLTDSEFCWRRLLGDKAVGCWPTRHKGSTGTKGSEVDR